MEKKVELDPKDRDWVYDDNGIMIYKHTKNTAKKIYEDFKQHGMYHEQMNPGNVK